MLPRLTLILAILGANALRADDSFTKSLTPAEFEAAGLGKLTPDQLAALDALVRARQTGAVAVAKAETTKVVTATVREETAKAVAAQVREETAREVAAQVREETAREVAAQVREETTKAVTAQVQAEDRKAAQKQAATAGFMSRLKVVLTPGTEIEYTTLDAALATPFHGWREGTIFTLTNGQRWVVTDDDKYWAPDTGKPVHVRIVPGVMGSFFMEIEKGGRPRVRFLGNTAAPDAPK
jgi:hypothetical protein